MVFGLYIFHFLYAVSLPIPNPILLILAYSPLPTDEFEWLPTIKTTIQEFATISFVCQLIVGIIIFSGAAIATRIRARHFVGINFNKWTHWMLLSLFMTLVVHTSLAGFVFSQSPEISGSDLFTTGMKKELWVSPLQILYQLKMFGQGEFLLKPYLPAIFDICDGVDMVTSKLNPNYPPWVNIVICLAGNLFFVASFLEIDHLKFPELTNGSFFSERRLRISQIVFLSLFCITLFVHDPSIADAVFTLKTFATLYYLYMSN